MPPTDSLPDVLSEATRMQNERLCLDDTDLGLMAVPSIERAEMTFHAGDIFGVWTRIRHEEDSQLSLWGALTQDVLALRSATPMAPDALESVIEQMQQARADHPAPGESSLVIRLPIAEREAARVLLTHGLRLATTTAIRRLGQDGTATMQPIRAATPDDIDAIVSLLAEMHRSDVDWGGAHDRPGAAGLLSQYAHEALGREGWTWVAEESGRVTGVASMLPVEESQWAAASTSLGPITHFGLLAVAAGQRGRGVGSDLVRVAHARAAQAGAQAVVLDHATLSPLSSTFWHRRGYRPLWTTWVR